jgi:L,D-peptidoglycan transpeptidase YkuD (ErfK/YbiS/YcfS/YnhG family)
VKAARRVLATGALLAAIGIVAAVIVAASATTAQKPTSTAAADTPAGVAFSAPTESSAMPSDSVSLAPSVTAPTTLSATAAATTAPQNPAPPQSDTTSPAPPRAPPVPRSSAAAVPRGQELPLNLSTGAASKVITVTAASTAATAATLQAWNAAPGGGWLPYGAAVAAHLGTGGLTTQPSETKPATPIGSFTLTQAFGSAANPGTPLPYFRTDPSDWWVSDANSPLYNTHQRCSTGCPFNTAAGENLYQAGFVYTYAVVIDYNRSPVTPGAGSAFFLHVSNGSATVGCISIPEANLIAIMDWLTPASQPRILIGVG